MRKCVMGLKDRGTAVSATPTRRLTRACSECLSRNDLYMQVDYLPPGEKIDVGPLVEVEANSRDRGPNTMFSGASFSFCSC